MSEGGAPAAAAGPVRGRGSGGPRGALLDRAGVALLVLLLALVATAGVVGLIEPTETRYAEIAREMRESGDWLTPRLDGLTHFHKPPLAYWAAAAGFAACGVNEWGARLPVALASAASLGFAALAARRRFGSPGVPAALVVWLLGSSVLFATVGRALASDPFLAAAVAGFWALAPSPWALACLGAGFLAKGPVVFVPTALALLVAAALARDRAPLALLGPARGWWLFAAIGLPWYLVVVARTRGLARYFLADQLWARYATTEYQRGGPPWYFLAVLAVGALPWTPALVAGLARALRERARLEARLLVAWLLVPLAFFSFSGSKLPAYLLPALPAAALLAARGLSPASRAVRWSGAGLLAAAAVAGWTFGPAVLARQIGLAPPGRASLPLGAHAGLACLAVAAAWMPSARPARAALLVTVGLTALLVALAPVATRFASPRGMAGVLRENRVAAEPVIEFSRFDAGVPFYLGERLRLLEVEREERFETPAEREAAIVTRDTLAAMVEARGRVWVVGPEGLSADLATELGLRYRITARGPRTALGLVTR